MKIKYDKRITKVLFIMACASLVFFLAGMLVMHFELAGLELVFIFGVNLGGGLFLFSSLNLIAAGFYFRRLRRHGYEIPYNRKEYKNNLCNVPVSSNFCERRNVSDAGSKESRILGILSFAIFLSANLWNIRYFVIWNRYLNTETVYLLCIQMILDLGWLIAAITYLRQQNNESYRDDVETDLSKKERTSIEMGILTCLVFLAAMVFVKSMVTNVSDYVFHARQAHDQSIIEDIQRSICAELSDRNQKDADMLKSCDSYVQMVEGCYLSDWNTPQDTFAAAIAESMGISDYSELVDDFYTSDGRARIYVKLSREQVYVRLENPLPVNHGTQPAYEAGEKLE